MKRHVETLAQLSITTLFVLGAFCAHATSLPFHSNEDFEQAIPDLLVELSIADETSSERSKFQTGERVVFRLKMTNVSRRNLTIYMGGPGSQFTILSVDKSRILWSSTWQQIFVGGRSEKVLAPLEEHVFGVVWDQTISASGDQVDIGEYVVVANVAGYQKVSGSDGKCGLSATRTLEIQP